MFKNLKMFIGELKMAWYMNVTLPRQLHKMQIRISRNIRESFKNIDFNKKD